MTIHKPSQHFPALTGIRAVAVYLIYLHHTNPFSSDGFGNFWHRVVTEFHIGVSIFFVLSGFLITYRYGQSAPTLPWLKRYFKNRVARVYPMYFLITTLSAIAFAISGREGLTPWFTYFMNITFLRGFFDDLKFTLVGQGWSLTVEECFYFLAPLLFLAFRKSRWALAVLPIILVALGCWLVTSFSGDGNHGFFNNYFFMFVYTFPGRCAEFFWGAALALFLQSGRQQQKQGEACTWGGLAILIALVVLLSRFGDGSTSGIFTTTGVAINNFLLPASIVTLFYGLLTENSILKKILSSNIFVLLGKSSYTFYLIHVGIFYQFIETRISDNYLILFLLLNIISLALWRLVEEPLNQWIRGRKDA